jgi:Fur family zinc uptake transcriptional regulator
MQQVANTGDAKLTRNQGLVLSVLEGAGQPLSAYGILDRLRDEGLKAPLQVYRALDKLVEAGRVHRLESMNAFVVCCHSNHAHIHPRVTAFEICDACGKVSEFHDEALEDALMEHARHSRFKNRTAAIEIRGICRACR